MTLDELRAILANPEAWEGMRPDRACECDADAAIARYADERARTIAQALAGEQAAPLAKLDAYVRAWSGSAGEYRPTGDECATVRRLLDEASAALNAREDAARALLAALEKHVVGPTHAEADAAEADARADADLTAGPDWFAEQMKNPEMLAAYEADRGRILAGEQATREDAVRELLRVSEELLAGVRSACRTDCRCVCGCESDCHELAEATAAVRALFPEVK